MLVIELRAEAERLRPGLPVLAQQPQAPHALVALAPDHDVVVQQDAQLLRGCGHRLRHGDIVLGRRGIAGGMVVHHDDGRGFEL